MVEIAYVDEIYDNEKFAMSALIVPVHAWRVVFQHVQEYRKYLKGKYGIFTSKEFHATDFVAGRGRIAPRAIPKGLRAAIFHEYLQLHVALPVALISGVWDLEGTPHTAIHAKAFSRIQERLQRRCIAQNSHMLMIADEGRAKELHQVARRSKIWNPVGSQFGAWEDGSTFKNIPNERLVEDPVFKASHQSYFLQSVDFIAFALLKSEVAPTEKARKYRLDKAYETLESICVKEASRKDTRGLGIVRT